jgi:hypothetical protein
MRSKNEVLCAAAGRLAVERSEADKPAKAHTYSAFTFVLDQSRLWKFGELYGRTVAE